MVITEQQRGFYETFGESLKTEGGDGGGMKFPLPIGNIIQFYCIDYFLVRQKLEVRAFMTSKNAKNVPKTTFLVIEHFL